MKEVSSDSAPHETRSLWAAGGPEARELHENGKNIFQSPEEAAAYSPITQEYIGRLVARQPFAAPDGTSDETRVYHITDDGLNLFALDTPRTTEALQDQGRAINPEVRYPSVDPSAERSIIVVPYGILVNETMLNEIKQRGLLE